jgi:hypothetical protein
MLYSPSMNIGFAHYPKTAGHSLTKWFREAFPDASLIEQHPRYEVNHLSVRYSLERLGLVEPCPPSDSSRRRRIARASADLVRSLGSWIPARGERSTGGKTPCVPRIIGVVREPFQMLVSLFEYWRGYDFSEEPSQPLIRCARTGTFHRFLEMAVVEHAVQNYRDFFDMDGPASAHTRLLDFNALKPALLQVCREFGVEVPADRLGVLNTGPNRHRSLEHYRVAAGNMLPEVRSHFRWYYEEGVHLMVKGNGNESSAPTGGGTA